MSDGEPLYGKLRIEILQEENEFLNELIDIEDELYNLNVQSIDHSAIISDGKRKWSLY